MKRFVTFLFVCVAIPCFLLAQTTQDFASRFMKDRADDDKISCITVGPKMLEMMMKLVDDKDKKPEMKAFLSQIKSIRIINSDNSVEKYRKEALDLLENSGKRYSLYQKNDSTADYGDCVWVRKRSDKIIEFVYVCPKREKEFTVLNITGRLDENFLNSLVRKKD